MGDAENKLSLPEPVSMRIAVTSQNFRTVTGHAGKARRFMIFEASSSGPARLADTLDLPRHMSMHEHPRGAPHPIDGIDVLVTASCGDGFVRKMAERGIRVVTTAETNPVYAAEAIAAGKPLPAAAPHADDQGDDDHSSCSCGSH